MRKRLFSLLATTAIVVGACGGSATPSPSASSAAPPASTGAGASASAPAPSASGPADINAILYGANYNPTPGTKGGKVVVGEWEAPTQLNYYFSNSFANTEVLAMTMRSGLIVSADGHYMPDLFATPLTFQDSVKKDASGTGYTVHAELKPNEKWSDGQPLTMNDYTFTWQRVQDKDATGVATLGWENIDKIVRRLDRDHRWQPAAAGALLQGPRRQGRQQGLSADLGNRQRPDQRPVQVPDGLGRHDRARPQ